MPKYVVILVEDNAVVMVVDCSDHSDSVNNAAALVMNLKDTSDDEFVIKKKLELDNIYRPSKYSDWSVCISELV